MASAARLAIAAAAFAFVGRERLRPLLYLRSPDIHHQLKPPRART
jgi:hypothetical protein